MYYRLCIMKVEAKKTFTIIQTGVSVLVPSTPDNAAQPANSCVAVVEFLTEVPISDCMKEQWRVASQSQLDHSINHCTLATVITYKPSADLYGTFYVHQRIVDTQEGYAKGRQRIARMVATHNALAGFPDPEADVRTLVEALERIRDRTLRDAEPPELRAQNENNYRDAVQVLSRLRREP